MSTYDRLLDRVQTLATEHVGPGAAVSVDAVTDSGIPVRGFGFVGRAWNAHGYIAVTDEVGRPNRAAAARALQRLLERRKEKGSR